MYKLALPSYYGLLRPSDTDRLSGAERDRIEIGVEPENDERTHYGQADFGVVWQPRHRLLPAPNLSLTSFLGGILVSLSENEVDYKIREARIFRNIETIIISSNSRFIYL